MAQKVTDSVAENGNSYVNGTKSDFTEPDQIHRLSNGENQFWSVDGYDNAVKRVEASSSVCTFVSNMATDYASLEAKYAKDLNDLAEKYSKAYEKQKCSFPKDCFQYGSWGNAVEAILNHISAMSRAHMENWTTLHSNSITPLINYMSNDLLKSSGINLSKDLKEEFKDAQKTWLGILSKVSKSREKYLSLLSQEEKQNATIDSPVNENKVVFQSKKSRSLEKRRKKYQDLCDHMQLIIPMYKENMSKVFEKCQSIERSKLRVFQQSAEAFYKVANFQMNNRYVDTIQLLEEQISKINIEDDLIKWNQEFGPLSSFRLEKYQNYKLPGILGMVKSRSIQKDSHIKASLSFEDKKLFHSLNENEVVESTRTHSSAS